jgi:two-component system, cell cycle sensor histidine kinase and response regulator CckA
MHSDKPHSDRAPSSDDAQVAASITDSFREFEAVVEHLEEMIVMVDRDCRYVMANQAYLNYRGAQREQIVGHLAADILSSELFEKAIRPKLDECFQQNRVVKFELTAESPRLGMRDLLISYCPSCRPSGVERVASITQDITERKRGMN